jgi:uridine kinase
MNQADNLFSDKEISSYKITKIVKRDGRIVAFRKDKISEAIFRAAVEVGGSDRDIAEQLANKVVMLMNERYPQGAIPSVEELQDIVEQMLAETGHFRTAKAYILYREKHKQIRDQKSKDIIVQDNIPYKLLWNFFIWNVDHNCDTVEKLNKQIKDGTIKNLIADAEAMYHNEVRKVANIILERIGQIKMLIVAGPSSSGKTTTTTKIGEVLKGRGIDFVLLNLDNYFKNLEDHPKDEYGDYDFETPQALDLPLINEHLFDLLHGKTIKMPFYDFKQGRRYLDRTEFRLKPNQILLIDSLHGLYDEMTKSIPHDYKFKFYIEAIALLRDNEGEFVEWTDLRMLRRMIRDSWHRAYDPLRTVGHWHYVRRSEKQHIVPFINKVDYVFNGALPYEFPIHKKFMFKEFPGIIKAYENDPKKIDAYTRAKRVYKFLEEIEELDGSLVPENSLLREFIGGSSYKY